MAATDKTHVVVDVAEEEKQKGRRTAATGRSLSDGGSDGSDEEEQEEEEERCSSQSGSEIVERESSVSESSVEVDLECGLPGAKMHLAKVERDCRICHLSMDATNHESGIPIELGCSCKADLAAAHKQCAEAWFRIKGNKTCEICGSTARNVVGVNEAEVVEQWNEANDTAIATSAAGPVQTAESRNFWQGHRFLNFLLACMVFAFVISWLFHFNVPS